MSVCTSCGEENPERASFCLACASPLAEEPESESLKTVTIVFCDMTGSTALGERLDAESLRRVMARYFEETSAALEAHGGTVEKFIGDAVMAVFGVPAIHEDDALRAVRAAAEMGDRIAALNGELQRRWQVSIGVRIGVNTGHVVAGDPSNAESFVVGDAVNVAARLEQTAGPQEILLGERTYRLTRNAIEAEPVDPLELKGKAEKVPAYRLLGLTGGSKARRLDSSLIGREDELEVLEEAFAEAIELREITLRVVVGAAGTGKSRLADGLASRLAGRARVLHGRCPAYGEGITFWPLAEMLREAAAIAEFDSPPEVVAKLSAGLSREEDAEAIATRLAGILGAAPTSTHQEETFWAAARYLEALAKEQPLLVFFDDIHWAEAGLLDLIEFLEDRSSSAPILIVLLARPEIREARRHLVGRGAIRLGPLNGDDAGALIAARLGGGELPADVLARLGEAAAGNPLFIEEMVQMLIDDGYLERGDEGWRLVRELTQDAIPPSIEALLGARLDRLRDRERDLAQRASIAGQEFARGALSQLAPASVRAELGVHLEAPSRSEGLHRGGAGRNGGVLVSLPSHLGSRCGLPLNAQGAPRRAS